MRYDRKRKNSGEKKTEVSFKGIKKIHIYLLIYRAASPPATQLKPSNQDLLTAAVEAQTALFKDAL
jgi:hypothetical protein